jgi:hypothetical protein
MTVCLSVAFFLGVANPLDQGHCCATLWTAVPLLDHFLAMTWKEVIVGTRFCSTMTSNYIITTTAYLIWREEHFWNASVLQRARLSNVLLVIIIIIQSVSQPYILLKGPKKEILTQEFENQRPLYSAQLTNSMGFGTCYDADIRSACKKFSVSYRILISSPCSKEPAIRHPISFRSISILSPHIRLCLPSGLFSPRFKTAILYTFLISSLRAKYPCPFLLYLIMLIIFAAGHSGRAVWGVDLGRLVAGIVGSNPALGMDVCPRLSVLCCPV